MANEADEPAELTIKKLQLAWEMIQKTAYHDLGPQLVLSQLGCGICLRKGPIELSCLVGSVDGGGGNDGQGQIRGAAGTGTTGRAPATDPGWAKAQRE